ncbi:RNA polymerase sigma factor SigJ [Herbiconiux flava]|uniref:RNA polymerase sigma-70 factor (ECF subfamily) n=1 Tax=Herbiconiux flava TaxID=881268 RepID=A0A852SQA9_9MICO|nr:RNA polymerase sigma factor SigJ [Herbiconiux flava]NYD71021.1 RNA polymerase sigma-70 factor (ECF subfamily) [Herbiconiux flava]GLK19015.1 RNA polymerase sigma24 factor [Herbiconiux flava]
MSNEAAAADTAAPDTAADTAALAERRHLLNLAFRMLGTTADAEDAVQETYARWFRLPENERTGIRSPQAWLTRVASNVCLDVLGSARHRREQYTGEWLPEPVGRASDPLDQVLLDDSVTMALLVVLESLSPAERVAFVLHDVFAVPFDEIAEIVGRTPQAARKLASTARKHVAERRRREAPVETHTAVVKEFWAACRTGELAELLRLLDPAVEMRVDGGGKVRAALRPIYGADRVARFVLGILSKPSGLMGSFDTVNGRMAMVFRQGAVVAGVVSFDVKDGVITDLWFTMTPDKLRTFARA